MVWCVNATISNTSLEKKKSLLKESKNDVVREQFEIKEDEESDQEIETHKKVSRAD